MSPHRWVALDLMRLAAMCLMVQGHTFRELLSPTTARTGYHQLHDFIHGFTAPMFLVGAGLAFGLSTFHRLERHLTWTAFAKKRARRYAIMILVGCALSLPDLSIVRSLGNPSGLLGAVQLGPLQLIGTVMISVQACLIGSGRLRLAWSPWARRTAVAVTCGLVAVGVLLAAPAAWALPSQTVPRTLLGLLNGSSGSTFPIFPWAAFPLLGVAISHLVVDERGCLRVGSEGKLAIVGVTLMGTTFAAWWFRVATYDPAGFWRSSPVFMAFLLGGVLASVCVFGIIGEYLPAAIRQHASTLSEASLVIYVAHLLILYGSPLTPGGLRSAFGHRLTSGQCSLLAGVFLVALFIVAQTWRELSQRDPRTFGRVQASLGGALIYFLFIR